MRHEVVAERPVDVAGGAERGHPGRLRGGRVGPQRVERLAGHAEPLVERGQLGLLLGRRRGEERRRVDVLERLAPLRNVVEVRQDLVELLLRDRVELVVVAAGAAHRQAEPDRGRRLDAVDGVLDEELVDDDAPLAVLAVVAVERGGDALVAGRTGQHVASELLDGEPVERHVGVVGVDHPVAPAPHRSLAVGLVAVGVGVAGRVEPLDRHPLAVARRAEQPVDRLLVGVRGVVVQERGELARRRRQPRQVERRAPQQRRPVGLRRRRQALALEAGEDKAVDRVAEPVRVSDRGHRRSFRRHERPVGLPLRPLVDPEAQGLDLVVRERFAAARHPLGGVRGRDAVEEEAAGGVAGHHDRPAEPRAVGERPVLDVEAEPALPAPLVRPVATEAVLGEERPDLAREVDHALRHRRCRPPRGGGCVRQLGAPRRAAVDPAAYGLDRVFAQALAQRRRRHAPHAIDRDQPLEQRARLRVARHHVGGEERVGVEPQVGLPRALVRPVATEAGVGEERPDVADVVGRLHGTLRRCAGRLGGAPGRGRGGSRRRRGAEHRDEGRSEQELDPQRERTRSAEAGRHGQALTVVPVRRHHDTPNRSTGPALRAGSRRAPASRVDSTDLLPHHGACTTSPHG